MEWDDYASTWDGDDAVRAYARAAFESLGAEVRRRGVSLAGVRVCDFGCGTGSLTERLVDSCEHIDAVDASPAMLDVLDEKVRRHRWTRVSTHREVPSGGPAYGLIVCSSVCGFLDDYAGTVSELAARLKPGGLFVQWDWELDATEEESHGLSRVAVHDALAGAGLHSITVETGFSIRDGEQTMAPLMGVGQL